MGDRALLDEEIIGATTYLQSVLSGDSSVCGETSCGKALKEVSGIDVKEIRALKTGAVFWHDRDYAITEFPDYTKGGHYIEQPHNNINKGSVISITTTSRSKIYVAVEVGNGRDGGFRDSLPKAGWEAEEGSVNNTCCALSAVFSKSMSSGGTVTLPALATRWTVMLIVVVPVCETLPIQPLPVLGSGSRGSGGRGSLDLGDLGASGGIDLGDLIQGGGSTDLKAQESTFGEWIRKSDKQECRSVCRSECREVSAAEWVKVGDNVECDGFYGGEVYLESSRGKVPTLEACKKACEAAKGCKSITYFKTKWCSHWSTPCAKTKWNKKADVSMTLK